MSWLDDVDRESILEHLNQYKEVLGEDDYYEEEEENEDDDEEEEGYEGMLKPRRKTFEDEEEEDFEPTTQTRTSPSESETDDLAGDESKTISIPSHDSSSDASDEFLFINPEDVITALKNFCEDYNERQKV